MSISSDTLRTLIVRALWIGASLLPLLAVTGLMCVWLAALGDVVAAAAVRGILCVVASCLALDFIALVVLLAVASLRLLDHDKRAD